MKRRASTGEVNQHTATCCVTCGRPLGHRATDKLTGLLDRWAWDEAASAVLRGSVDRPVALMLVDLDRFKEINDTHGHLAGDDVIRAAATTIEHAVRQADIVGRFGGDEFLVLLPAADPCQAALVAKRVLTRMSQLAIRTLSLRGDEDDMAVITGLTASIGIALRDVGDLVSLRDLLRQADSALLRAKHSGRAQAAFASPVAHARTLRVPA